MEKTILALLIVFHFLKPDARHTTLSYNSFVKSETVSLFNLPPAGMYQNVKDFGDAPAGYGSADHTIDNINYLGSVVDQEPSSQPSASADADDNNGADDEDGVIFPTLTQGAVVSIPVTLSGTAYLNAWIDWNGDGDFNDNGERIVTDALQIGGTINLSVIVPADAIVTAPTFARFRFGPLSTAIPAYSSSGSADYGEVEDYQITILCTPPAIPVQKVDCSLGYGKGVVTVTSPVGAGLEYRLNGGPYQISTTFNSVSNGNHIISVRNSSGCYTSGVSFPVACGCVNPPTVALSKTIGSTCGTTPVTISDNTFGGSATAVTITENGSGSVSPGSANRSPFAFTYTPATGDLGKTIIISITTNNLLGFPCTATVATFTLTVDVFPKPPVAGTITQPTCSMSTGSVVLNGLPSTGAWILTRMPGAVVAQGTGTSTTSSGLSPGTYTYTVSNASGCKSGSSANVVIKTQPVSPANPLQSVNCSLGFGKAVVTVTSPVGAGLEYMLDGGSYQKSTVFSAVADGNHTITVRNTDGCTATGVIFPVLCGCVNPPTIALNSINGSTCGTTAYTLNNNFFGGSATNVIITENGSGSVSSSSISTSPFSFTYNPASGDAGKTVIVTITTNNPLGTPCSAAVASFTLTVNALPPPPVIGTITQPACNISTGSVNLSGLPSGTWTLIRNPGGISRTGNGPDAVISDLTEGTHSFTVTSSTGCTSATSASVVVNAQPKTPAAPLVGSITRPDCFVPTGSVVLNGFPSTGYWILTRYPGTYTLTGTGTGTTISGLAAGTYNFTVANADNCISSASVNVVIPPQPAIPTAPVIGTVTHPTCLLPSGQAELTGLPAAGAWTLTRTPGGVTQTGTGTSTIVANLAEGTYTFTVLNSVGCSSVSSSNVTINPKPANLPVVRITNPAPVCSPATSDLTSGSIVQGTTSGLVYSFWRDAKATLPYSTPGYATDGTYYIKGTSTIGCFDIKPVNVKVVNSPTASAGPDQVLEYLFKTTLEANLPGINETGRWALKSGSGEFADSTYAQTSVKNLSIGDNKFLWTVTNGICVPAKDSVKITVKDLIKPTLITPNGDNKNEYFVIEGLKALGKTELVVYDRRGVRVYQMENYDNRWNGVDHDGNPLPAGTYFYGLRAEIGKYITGYIVIRYSYE